MLAVLAGALAPAAHAAGRCGNHPWCDRSLSPDERAARLLSALTVTEKIGLLAGDELTGVSGRPHSHTGTSDGVPRVGLPTMYLSDGPVGPRQGQTTALPIPMALAATWDPALARAHGRVVATEARDKGNDVVYAPTVNIMRTPLGGRTFEGYGEDPYLVSRTGVGWIEGAQKTGVIANVKHFAANNQEGYGPEADQSRPGQVLGPPPTEGGRMSVSVEAAERTLREIYLPQFEAAVKEAKVGTVMCSYNKLRSVYACQNPHLLDDVLRKDWGFKGFTIADYAANHDTAPALRSGLDFEPWPGRVYGPEMVTPLVLTGQIPQATIDLHIRRILRTLFAFGFFDRPAYADDDNQIPKAAHARTAQTIEENAITLLRNRRKVLPLRAGRTRQIAVIGKPATQFVTGGGSGKVSPFAFSPALDAIKARAGSTTKVVYDDGSDAARAAALAKSSSVALVFAADYQTEGIDRRCISLECPPWLGDQDALIGKVAAANKKTVVVLETGGPVLTPWRARVAGIVEAWYPGQRGGPALARMLFGDTDPAGRLPATFPRSEADEPVAGDKHRYPGVNEVVDYSEGVLVGYRWWDAKKKTPAYPFGAGRSYSSFAMRGLRVKKLRGGRLAVSVDVRNTGRRRGVAVPELYVGIPSPRAGVNEPPRQLKGYRKLRLRRGAHRRVRFTLGPRAFAYWESRANAWRVAPGCYRVMVGPTSRNVARTKRIGLRGGRCR